MSCRAGKYFTLTYASVSALGAGTSTFPVAVARTRRGPLVALASAPHVGIAKARQTISFTAPASGTSGGSDTLSATGGGSGNPVTFTIDSSSDAGVCSVSGTNGSTLKYGGAGNCVIDANQAGNANYSPATQTQGTTAVQGATPAGKASQTISFTAPRSGTFGGSDTLSATGGASGNPVTFTIDASSDPRACSVSGTNGTTLSYTGTGNCVIDANQAGNSSYSPATQTQGTTSVGKAPQTISFTAPSSGTFGGSQTLSTTGGGSGNPVVFTIDSSSDAGACSVSGTNGSALHYTGVGSCVIDANQAGNDNYSAAAQVQGTTTVSRALQTISFTAPASGINGHSATLSATGGGSGNPVVFTIDSSSGSGVCSVSGTNGTTLSYTGVGSCVIDANQAGSANYSAAVQVQGTTTVVTAAPAVPVIRAAPFLDADQLVSLPPNAGGSGCGDQDISQGGCELNGFLEGDADNLLDASATVDPTGVGLSNLEFQWTLYYPPGYQSIKLPDAGVSGWDTPILWLAPNSLPVLQGTVQAGTDFDWRAQLTVTVRSTGAQSTVFFRFKYEEDLLSEQEQADCQTGQSCAIPNGLPTRYQPGEFSVSASTAGAGSADVSWTAADPGDGGGPVSYTLRCWDETAQSFAPCGSETSSLSETVTGLTPGDTYKFFVSATNALGIYTTPNSSPLTITG